MSQNDREASGLRYKNKITIITGGSRGIGKGIAEIFVQEGAKVVFCSNDETEGRETEKALQMEGPGQATFVPCELTEEHDIQRLIQTTLDTHGRIDCLINNAGTHPPHVAIDEVSAGELRQLMEINVVAVFLMCKYALPYLRQTGGNIINIGSLVTHIGEGHSVIYGATKGAVEAMNRTLAVDEVKHGVRVNAVIPGNVWTPLWESVAHTFPDPAKVIETGKAMQMMGRFGTAQEIGKACMYLAADATFSTGTETLVTGGAELDFSRKVVSAD